jgi:hypothetical protein
MKNTTIRFRKATLYADALFLVVIGGVQVVFEFVGYLWGIGPLGAVFHDSSYTIGFVEAHGLALLSGIVLLAAARHAQRRWNGLGLAIHALLGAANLIFWTSFTDFHIVPAGVAATAAHGVFVLAHGLCLAAPGRRLSLQ